MAYRLGLILGAIVGVLVGAWFVYTTATVGGVGVADLRLLAAMVVACLVIAAVLALAADISSFFPGLGLGFCVPAALASLACVVISGFHGWVDVALGYAVVMLGLMACFIIIVAISPRMYARG